MTTHPKPASPKQIEWIDKCMAGKQHQLTEDYFEVAKSSSKAASAALDHLFSLPWKPRQTAAKAPNPVTTPGLYVTGDDVYKVVRSHAGRLYALKLCVPVPGQPGSFEYDRDHIDKVSADHPLTLAEARRLGGIHNICVCCAAVLEDTISQARKIGPSCEEKLTGRAGDAGPLPVHERRAAGRSPRVPEGLPRDARRGARTALPDVAGPGTARPQAGRGELTCGNLLCATSCHRPPTTP
jgi:bacterioferritin-associated ferredoxin